MNHRTYLFQYYASNYKKYCADCTYFLIKYVSSLFYFYFNAGGDPKNTYKLNKITDIQFKNVVKLTQ